MSFIFPSFLFALSAIAIPIIIHLVELRKSKRLLFTNLSFIKEVKQVTASHRRLKHLLILFSRILFILFFVLLFSQPYIPSANSAKLSTNNIMFFIDNSLSMQNEAIQNNISLLQESKDLAKGITEILNKNSSYQLGTNSKLSHVNYNAADINQQIEFITETALSRSFNSLRSWFNSTQDKLRFTGFVFSDFQRSNFSLNDLTKLDSVNQFYLVPIKNAREENLFIDTVYSEDAFIRQNENNKLSVIIRNVGSKEVKNCQVKFFIGNKQVSALSLTVPSNKTVPFNLTYRLNENINPSDCKIVIEDYPVTFDNTYYFNLKPSQNIRILEVGNNNFFGDKLFTNENVFQYTRASINNINYKQINQTDLLILNNINEIDASLAENFGSFIKAGGNIIVIPSSEMKSDSYQLLFAKLSLQNVSVLPKSDTIKTALTNPDYNNPFFENIFSEQSRNPNMPKATKVWGWSRSSSDILKFKGQGSFLSQFKVENGNVYLFASPLIDKFSDFQNHALFVPVMYKLAMLSSRQQQPMAYSLNSRIVNLPYKQDFQSEQIIKMRKDTLEYVPEQQIRKNQLVLGIPPEVNEAGFYDIMLRDKPIYRVAFNFDKRESDLSQYTADQLRTLTKNRKNITILDPTDELEIKKELNSGQLGTPLWKYCLILCMFFMLSEVLLIRYL